MKFLNFANTKGMNTADHFNQSVEIVKLGFGTFRKVDNMHLSRMACMIIAENADGKFSKVESWKKHQVFENF